MTIMGQIVSEAVEAYLGALNRLADPVLLDIERDGRAGRLPLVDAEVGALLRVLASAAGATRILEIGTAIGYSGIWLAGALPANGSLLTIEVDQERARTARANFSRAGLADRVIVIVGDARRMVAKLAGPFDVIFQDGDKHQYGPLLDRLAAMLRPGGLLISDNVLWNGEVVPGFTGTSSRGVDARQAIIDYNERLNRHPDLMTATVPLRDGVAISVRRSG